MSSFAGRLLGTLLRTILLLVLLSMLLSVAVTTGTINLGPEERIETPDPIPDWPFVWEIPLETNDSAERPTPDDPDAVGDPVQTDPGTTNAGDDIRSEEIEVAVHERINTIRAGADSNHEHDGDLEELAWDEDIADISRTYSHDMGERGYFSHVSPEGETPADRFGGLYPAPCRGVGENLARVSTMGASDSEVVADQVVEGWMNSPGHRENILRAQWDSQGIGVYINGSNVYATQKFCGG